MLMSASNTRFLLSASFLPLVLVLACSPEEKKRILGDPCGDDAECESGICYENACLDPDGDLDGDGLRNGVEKNLSGTDYRKADTDGDDVPDGIEVGADPVVPADRDGDGRADALESRLAKADADRDCIPDEFDPRNDVADSDPALLVALGCPSAGVCGAGASAIEAGCEDGVIACDLSRVAGWQEVEAACDGLDNDCDGQIDQGALVDPDPDGCPAQGVCGEPGVAAPGRSCRDGAWACVFDHVPGWQAVESLCDGLDNDCDGQTDEELTGGTCTHRNDAGSCEGTWKCAASGGDRVCDGPVPEAETCDGRDNDCDGSTDEGLAGVACTRQNAAGTCAGVTVCDGAGGAYCDAPVPANETCNLADDDCDGSTDEDGICTRTATVRGTVRAITQAPATGRTLATTGLPPLLPGAVVRVGPAGTCTGTMVQEGTYWQATTGTDGAFDLPVAPGSLCVRVDAGGYQAVATGDFDVAAGDVRPVQAILTPEGSGSYLACVCGRVTTAGTGEVPPPIAGALVSGAAQGSVDAEDPVVATTDAQGFYCLAGLPTANDAPAGLLVQAMKDGFFPSQVSADAPPNVVRILDLSLAPIPDEATACLDEDFEATEVVTLRLASFGAGWTSDEWTGGVGWNRMSSPSPLNGAFDGCVSLPAGEDCVPGEAGCPLCGEVPSGGCLPSPGALPNAFSGALAMWFGNLATGNYLATGQACDQSGPRVGGSLVSPWVSVAQVADLALSFAGAFEVESYDPRTDRLLVEVQTGAMAEAGNWNLVANLKDETQPSSLDPALGLSSTGLGGSPLWKEFRYDLSPWSGESIRIRFRFDSVDGNYNAFRGWLVDRVRVTGRGCNAGEPTPR